QSFWSEKPMIHLLPDWNFDGLEGEEIRVVCYTNCEEAELFLNGSSLGRLRLERFDHGEWHVPYAKGVLSVIGYIGGEAVCSDEKKTSKKAAALMLRQENLDVSDCGRDVALITCTCIDEDGTEVPDAAPYVRFAVKGEGRIIGTGSDISDHIPPNVTDRQMRAGRVLAGALIGKNADEVRVYACADGLKSAVCRIEIKRNEG
ncbi:MAG: DUF4982 domain-containing protein, partial [Clostridiales bacterium]|nr:DUF4982 domain-containing protein [Clostridiales bacterium]